MTDEQCADSLNAKSIPHQAVILVKAEVMERLPNGKVSGVPKKIISRVYTVVGNSYNECVENTNVFIDNINIDLNDFENMEKNDNG